MVASDRKLHNNLLRGNATCGIPPETHLEGESKKYHCSMEHYIRTDYFLDCKLQWTEKLQHSLQEVEFCSMCIFFNGWQALESCKTIAEIACYMWQRLPRKAVATEVATKIASCKGCVTKFNMLY